MAFLAFPLHADGKLAAYANDAFPTQVSAWTEAIVLGSEGHHFGYVQSGRPSLVTPHGSFTLSPGMYFSQPGHCEIRGGSGIVMTRIDWLGLRSVGGPIEDTGRLRYIDGCTDTLLVAPARKGDPCLNLLHIPAHTRQTSHTHPSMRAGIIASGSGRCVTPDRSYPLTKGLAFVITTGTRHAFHTDDEALRVIAYHPESDYGPTDEVHPMINRTVVS